MNGLQSKLQQRLAGKKSFSSFFSRKSKETQVAELEEKIK